MERRHQHRRTMANGPSSRRAPQGLSLSLDVGRSMLDVHRFPPYCGHSPMPFSDLASPNTFAFWHDLAARSPAEAARFLGIIAKHVDRLNTIVEDLLSLSRIENEGEAGSLRREKARLRDIAQNAIQICRPRAEEKRIAIGLSGEPGCGCSRTSRIV